MKTKRNCLVRLDRETRDKLKTIKRNLEPLENDDIPLGEIIKRMSEGEDMYPRLRQGAIERNLKRR